MVFRLKSAPHVFDKSSDEFAVSRNGVILRVNPAWCEILGNQRRAGRWSEGRGYLILWRTSRLTRKVRLNSACVERASSTCASNPARAGVGERFGATRRRRLCAHRGATSPKNDAWRRSWKRRPTSGLCSGAAQASSTWTYSPTAAQFHLDVTRDPLTEIYVPAARKVALGQVLDHMDEPKREGYASALEASAKTGVVRQLTTSAILDETGRRRRFNAC